MKGLIEDGKPISVNLWKITALNGEPPDEVKILESEIHQRGEEIATKTNSLLEARRKSGAKGNPQIGCGDGGELPQGSNAELRIGVVRDSADGVCGEPSLQTAKSRTQSFKTLQ